MQRPGPHLEAGAGQRGLARIRPNPARKLWHVEKDGRILDSGIGLGPCADWDKERAQAAVERIVNRIEDAIHAAMMEPQQSSHRRRRHSKLRTSSAGTWPRTASRSSSRPSLEQTSAPA